MIRIYSAQNQIFSFFSHKDRFLKLSEWICYGLLLVKFEFHCEISQFRWCLDWIQSLEDHINDILMQCINSPIFLSFLIRIVFSNFLHPFIMDWWWSSSKLILKLEILGYFKVRPCLWRPTYVKGIWSGSVSCTNIRRPIPHGWTSMSDDSQWPN